MIANYITSRGYTILPVSIIVIHLINQIKLDYVTSIPREHEPFHKQMISSQAITITDHESKFGYLSSPNYPQPYPINSSSFASLVAYHDPNLDTIRLTFEDLSVQISNYCQSEAIEIMLPKDPSTPEIHNIIFTICGTNPIEPLIVSNRHLLIRFTSDSFNPGKNRGFKIKFEFMNYASQLYDGCDQPNHFRCRNRRCVKNSLKCNRFDDCGDASDEEFMTPCQDLPTIIYSIDYMCGLLPPTNPLTNKQSKSDLKVDENELLLNRIVGGNKVTRRHGWPFQVSIQMMKVEILSHICGGTLIHPMFVLSAAHCFKSYIPITEYRFVFGSRDLKSEIQPEADNNVQVRYASSISLYPGGEIGLSSADITNDLALIELNAPVKLTSHVWPACLPHLSEPIVAGRVCLASGFGDTHGTGNLFSLKQVRQAIQHSSECHSGYSNFEVDDYSMICVKNELANGPCNGDSGGPLFCPDGPDNVDSSSAFAETEESRVKLRPGDLIKYLPMSDEDEAEDTTSSVPERRAVKDSELVTRYTVHGVTSFTTDGYADGGFCGLDTVPTIYARVSTKVEWILTQMKMAMHRLSQEDSKQNPGNKSAFFGYMFRSGVSRHKNFTRPMTVYSNNLAQNTLVSPIGGS